MRTLAISVSTCFVFRAQLPQCRARHAEHFGLKGVLEKPSIGSAKIPSIAFCVFQLMFAAITYVLFHCIRFLGHQLTELQSHARYRCYC